MIHAQAFKPWHFRDLDIREEQISELPEQVNHAAVTVMDGDTPIAVFGGFFFVPGVLHIWAFVSEAVKKNPLAFHKVTMEVLDFYIREDKPRRLQFEVRADFPIAQRWAEALGFTQEGLMRGWGPDGADYYLYGKVIQ